MVIKDLAGLTFRICGLLLYSLVTSDFNDDIDVFMATTEFIKPRIDHFLCLQTSIEVYFKLFINAQLARPCQMFLILMNLDRWKIL